MLTPELIRAILGWAAIFNLIFVVIWFLLFLFAHDWLYNWHRRWFDMPVQTFNAIHYSGMAFYKISIWMLFIMPYLALRLLL